ncbi:hypothetical protein ACPER7_04005 [Acinetobacter dispersus]|uniref:hypothetical protein n=1 Tax=Acinetobacter dispersus TaxID=70348 RepID=UPI003C2E7906
MNKKISFRVMSTILLIAVISCTGCETEQKKDQSSTPMTSYNEDFVKNQAQLVNEAKLKESSANQLPK